MKETPLGPNPLLITTLYCNMMMNITQKKCIFYGGVSTILIGSMSLMINNEKLAFGLGTSINHLNS